MKLRAVLKHSYENVLFYHRKFEQAKIGPDDIRTVGDLRKIPLTTREELQKLPPEFTLARNVEIEKCKKTTTSGTTGTPLNLILDRGAVEYGDGLWLRMYERNGLRSWDKMAVIRHPNYFLKEYWFQRVGMMQRRYISALATTEEQIRILEGYRPDAIKGYSSALGEIARFLKNGSERIKPRIIFTGGEFLSGISRNSIRSVFDTEPLDTYGTSEFSLVAWECREHSGYHVNADSVVMELLTGDGEEAAAGERGAVVCTGLHNYAMPLIRYKNDDLASRLDGECSCGVRLPLIKGLEGRESDLLMTLDGRLISPWRFYPFPFDSYMGIAQFTITQERRDRILFRLVVEKDTFDMSRLDQAQLNIKKLFGEEMQVEFRIIDKFEKETTGKMHAISRLF